MKSGEGINKEILKIQIDIVCDEHLNDPMHDRILC